MKDDIVPFGKYRDQSLEVLRADRQYCEWLLTQPWFVQRYKSIYEVLTHGGMRSEDTPEHNAMQARFLNEELCKKLAALFAQQLQNSEKLLLMEPGSLRWGINFEELNWDIIFNVRIRFDHSNRSYVNATNESLTAFIELKPIIGDDYSSVLRKVKNRPAPQQGRSLLIVLTDHFSSQAVTLDQARELFRKSGVVLQEYAKFLTILNDQNLS